MHHLALNTALLPGVRLVNSCSVILKVNNNAKSTGQLSCEIGKIRHSGLVAPFAGLRFSRKILARVVSRKFPELLNEVRLVVITTGVGNFGQRLVFVLVFGQRGLEPDDT